MNNSLEKPRVCRRCSESLASADQGTYGYECTRCGYTNASGRPRVSRIPLASLITPYSYGEAIRAAHTTESAVVELERLNRNAIAYVLQLVRVRRRQAESWLFALLRKLDSLVDNGAGYEGADSTPVRVMQLMYACLILDGPLDFRSSQRPDAGVFQDVYSLLGDIATVSNCVTLGRRGLRRYRIEEGELISTPTKEDDCLFEYVLDTTVRPEKQLRGYFEEFVDAAQRTAQGFAIEDVAGMLHNASAVDDHGWWLNEGGDDFICVRVEEVPDQSRNVLQRMTLTAGRLRVLQAPFYFDMGRQLNDQRDELETVAMSSSMMWCVYYPFLDCRHPGRAGSQERVAITTQRMLATAIVVATRSHAHLLASLEQVAEGEKKKEVQRLKREVHAELERLVGDRLRSMGFSTLVAFDRLGGKQPSCGEIDVIGGIVKSRDAKGLIVVCEVKNVDGTLHKDSAYEILRETVSRAEGQIERKRAWVALNWHKLAPSLGIPESFSVDVVGIIVTRQRVPLCLSAKRPCLSVDELQRAIEEMTSLDLVEWRNDVRAGLLAT